MSKTVKQAKLKLRQHIKSELSTIGNERILFQSRNVAENLFNYEKFQTSRKIGLYMNMPHLEIQTLSIIQKCFDMNKEVYLPKCVSMESQGRKMNHLKMLKVSTFQEVLNLKPQGKYKLLEPVEGEDAMETGDIDLIVIPGVAFNRKRQRLGHGAGFYDEFLNVYRLKFDKLPFLVGLGLQEQLIQQIPIEEHDFSLDCLIISGEEPIEK